MPAGDGGRGAGRSRGYNALVMGGAALLAGLCVVAGVLMFRGAGSGIRHAARQPAVVTDARQVTVDVIDNDFTPANLVVRKGATVTWQFKGSLPHNVTEASGAFASPTLRKGGRFDRTFDATGTLTYYCTIHHVMTGSIIVWE